MRECHEWWPPFRVALFHDSGSHTGSRRQLVSSIMETGGILITTYRAVVLNQEVRPWRAALERYRWIVGLVSMSCGLSCEWVL